MSLLSTPERRRAVWGTLLGVGIAYEYRELRSGDDGYPATAFLRWAFHTEHPAGRVVFVAATAWVCKHIVWDGYRVVGDVLDPEPRASLAESRRPGLRGLRVGVPLPRRLRGRETTILSV